MVIDKLIVGQGESLVFQSFRIVSLLFPHLSLWFLWFHTYCPCISPRFPYYLTISPLFPSYFPMISPFCPYCFPSLLPVFPYSFHISRYYFTIFFPPLFPTVTFPPCKINMLKLSNLTSLSIIWSSKYPLVMTNIAMENHYFFMGKSTITGHFQ